ncbi:hypothetical protein [Micromonospora sp. NPDC050200]|uniref:hypothetical protein n=1 Tax=Micromonospora sp. NPDC050200 TaxID=3155664 RepID=UPI0034035113
MTDAISFPAVRPAAVGRDRALLAGGVLAGPVFAVAWGSLIVRPGPVAMVAFGLAVTVGWAWVSGTFAGASRRSPR